MTTQTKELWGVSLLVIFSFLLYALSLNAPFYLDDQHMIVENIFIKNPKYFGWLWKGYVTSSTIPKGMCRPVLMLTFIFNYLSAGLSPSGYRVINVLFHFLNGMLLYSLLKLVRPQASKLFLFLIAAIFIAHPINTEAVIYISSRSDLLTAFFLLAGLILWIKEKPLAALAVYALALLTKESALCFPMLVFAWDFTQKQSLKKVFDKKSSFIYAAIALVTIVYFAYGATVFSRTPTTPPRTLFSNILVQTAVTFIYAKLFLLLKPFNMMHDVPNFTSVFALPVILGALTLAALSGYALRQMKKEPLTAFGIAWFLIGLLPKFYAKLGFPAMEHHAYIPLLGIYIVLAVILEKFYAAQKKYFFYSCAGVLAVLSLSTVTRGVEYTNAEAFWHIAVERAPGNGILHDYLGLEYLKHNRPDQAEQELLTALKIADRKETVVAAETNLAVLYNTQKRYPEALKLLDHAATVTKIIPAGVNQIRGTIYMSMDQKEKAVQAWEKEIALYPDAYEAALNLAIFYFKTGNTRLAKIFFERTVFLKPDAYIGYYGLGQTAEKEKDLPRAAQMYAYAVKLNPQDAAGHYFLGSVLSRLGDIRAIEHFQAAIELNPKFCEAHNDLSVAYASLKDPQWRLAAQEIENAKSAGCVVNEDFVKIVEKHTK